MIVVNVIYTGPLSTGRTLIQPLLDLNPLNPNISYIPWSEVTNVATYGGPASNCGKSTTVIPHAVNLYQIDVQALSKAVDYVNDTVPRVPALQSFVIAFTQYAQEGFRAGNRTESAFPCRDVVMYA